MLSLYTLKSASEASKYYQKGDYYTEAGTNEYSLWLGKGAAALNLEGPVDAKIFKALLEGHLPDGSMMIQTEQGKHHRPGYDLTFSAPKSVSILALVADNKEVLEAHRQSIKEVLAKIEEKYGSCRVKEYDNTRIEETKNFVAAAFEHSDSRAGDPHLHTHLVLMNMTQKANGEWRAIYADPIYTDKLLNGLEYRSILALKLLNLGYALKISEKGTFEIEAVPQTLIDCYSKRREEIVQWMEDNRVSDGEAASIANFQTRSHKVQSTQEERKKLWIQEAIIAGSSLEALEIIRDQAKKNGPIQLPDPYLIAQQSVGIAIAHLSQKQDFFSMKEILKSAKLISILPSSHGDFLNVVEQKIKDHDLLYVEGEWLTTPYLKELQNLAVECMQQGKAKVDKTLSGWNASLVSYFKLKTKTQREALKTLLCNQDQQVLISAKSPSMLNEVLRAFSETLSHQNYYPRFLTQQSSQVRHLKKKLNQPRVGTIEGFLLSCEIRAEKQKPPLFKVLQQWDQRLKEKAARNIWIIHGDVSLNQIYRLQNFAKQFGARLIFTETSYHSSSALALLKEKGIKVVSIEALKMHEENLKAKDALLKNIDTLEKQGRLQVVSNDALRVQTLAEKNIARISDSALVALSGPECTALNTQVRVLLKEQGNLKGSPLLLTSLQALSMTTAEKSQAQLYQLGDILRFNVAVPNTPIQKGSYFEVKNVNLNSKSLMLEQQGGPSLSWVLNQDSLKKIEIFRKEDKEICVGDKLVWTRTLKHPQNHALDRIKHEYATVLSVNDKNITVGLQSGKQTVLEGSDLKQQHWDHGYASTLKNIELGSFKEVNLMLSSRRIDDKTIHQLQRFIHETQEEKITVRVVCDDVEKLKTNIDRGGIYHTPSGDKPEVPYKREAALRLDQDIPTQVVFQGLQAEYLMARKYNPEFLPENLSQAQPEMKDFSPELRFACDVIDKLCLYHSERKAVFKLRSLKTEAAQLAGTRVPLETLEEAFKLVMEKGWLRVVSKESEKETWVAAKHTILIEHLCIEKMKAGQNQLTPLFSMDSPAIRAIQQNKTLTAGQKKAITLLLTTSDRMVAVQGIAGAGKTTALKEINTLCESISITPLVLANTGRAKNRAQLASGMDAMTLAQFLTRAESLLRSDVQKAKEQYGNNRIIILDEVSQVSTKDLFRLQTIVEDLGTYSSVIGDFKQEGSIGAGTGFFNFLVYGVNKALMNENVRLKEQTLFEAMKKAYAGDIKGNLHLLRDHIEEIPNKEEALNRLITLYTSMDQIERKTTHIIVAFNQDRKWINHQIREVLIKKNELQGQAISLTILLPNDSHEVNKKEISHYKLNDFIRFATHYPRVGVKAGDYAHITQVDLQHHRLTLQLENNKAFYWSPKNLEKPSDIQLYHPEERELMQNDSIIFKANNASKGIFNGDQASVLKVEGSEALVLLSNGKTLVLDFNKKEDQHLDHAYAVTTSTIQGQEGSALSYQEGPKPYIKNAEHLEAGEVIVLPAKDQPHLGDQYPKNSKLVKVLALNSVEQEGVQKLELLLKAREGHTYTLQKKPNDKVEYFPPFEQRKEYELPLSTSQQGHIVRTTRGNYLYLIVPYIDDFQKTLEKHQETKNSVLSYQDPHWKQLSIGVKRLVENLKWIANKEKESPEKAAIGLETPLKTKEPTKENRFIEKAEKETIKNVLKQYKKGIPIQGTLAEKYLRTFQGIGGELPQDFRFSAKVRHPNNGQLTPTLMVPLRDQNHIITGIVSIFLTPEGRQVSKTYLSQSADQQKQDPIKVPKNAAVFVQKSNLPGTLWIANGIETALSVAQALPNQSVIASVSSDKLKNVPVGQEVHKVIICADNNPDPHYTTNVIETIKSHLSNDKKVFLAMPGSKKGDFNDLSLQDGVNAVKAKLDQMIEIKDPQWLKNNGLTLEASFQKIQQAMPIKVASKEASQAPIERER